MSAGRLNSNAAFSRRHRFLRIAPGSGVDLVLGDELLEESMNLSLRDADRIAHLNHDVSVARQVVELRFDRLRELVVSVR